MEKIFKGRRKWTWAAGIIIIVCAGAGAWLASVAMKRFNNVGNVRICIPAGATSEAVSDTLRTRLGEDFGGSIYRLWSWMKGTPAKAHGSYVVAPGTSALKVSRMLKGGYQTPVKVTFNNVRTIDDLAERVCRNIEATPAQFMQACDSLMKMRGIKPELYAAMFVPDTHEFYWTAAPGTVVQRLLDAHDAYWNKERTDAASALGLTPEEVATLASIVEEETIKADERPKVARLYLNRLQKGMMLQADPTVKFAVGDFSLKRILSNHLKADSPYNTYIHAGLPPGPIRVASKAGIEATLHPATHQYIYMCAKEDFSGYHNFARTYDEHQANAARYRRALNARGI